MIKTTLAILMIFLSITALCQKETEITSSIEEVTIYLDGARVKRVKSVNISAGENKLVFTGLSSRLESGSVQVSVDDKYQILSVSDRINYLKEKKESKRIEMLKDSVEQLAIQIDNLVDEINTYKAEKNMLMQNQSIGGNQSGVSVDQLKQAANFYRSRLDEIYKAITSREQKLKKVNALKFKKENQLSALNASRTTATKEVVIIIKSNTAGKATIDLRYLVGSAGWAPSYDLRATDITKPIDLVYRANVFNNTNVDWNSVSLKLSTADPRKSANKPELSVWRISQYTSSSNYRKDKGNFYNQPAQEKETFTKEGIEYEEVDIPELSTEFSIKDKYNIPSDAKPYLVDVTEYNLQATYKHYAVPKMEMSVFLLARITGWEDLNLVEGPANVYYSGAYIGKSYIKTSGTNDTLDLSLGRDNKVAIQRKKLKDYTRSQFIGSNRKDILSYETTIRNNRKAPITIEVVDQVPISGDNSITITAIELSDADHDENTGMLSWNYEIQPSQSKSHVLTFSIKYPKTMSVSTQRHYKRVRAKF